jgi:hypothetical protein
MKKLVYLCSIFPIFVVCAMAVANGQAQEAESKPNLFGMVVDPLGEPIGYANIWIHESHDQKSYAIRVEKSGSFATRLPDGTYDLMIASPGLAPFSKYIWVHDGKVFNLRVRLKIDPDNLPMY